MKQREQLYTIAINGTERAALLKLLERATVTDYDRSLLSVLNVVERARMINSPSGMPVYMPAGYEAR